MPHPTITPSARGIGRGRLRGSDSGAARRVQPSKPCMPVGPVIFIASLGLACLAVEGLRADPLAPFEARDIALSGVTGVAYYTVEPEAYRVVATFAGEGDSPRIRLEALLTDDTSILVSTPPALGGGGEAVAIRRTDGRVNVEPAESGAGDRRRVALAD